MSGVTGSSIASCEFAAVQMSRPPAPPRRRRDRPRLQEVDAAVLAARPLDVLRPAEERLEAEAEPREVAREVRVGGRRAALDAHRRAVDRDAARA